MIKIGKLLKDIKKEALSHEDKNPNLYWALNKVLSEIFQDSLDNTSVEICYQDIFGDYVDTNEGNKTQLLFRRKEAMARLEVVNKILKKMGFKSTVICHCGDRDDKSFYMCTPFINVEFTGK